MINGLDLFTGIGGISLALQPWVRTVCYVEIDRYCQAVIRSRIKDGNLEDAPIWDDVTTFDPQPWIGSVDIIFGGFPCQDISLAGNGAGLDGERSGLFWEMHRLIGEIRPRFIYLENVPAITGRGGREVVGALASLGYDCRWGVLSAYDVGAPHQRDRWWCLAHPSSEGLPESTRPGIREIQGTAESPERGQPCGRDAAKGEWWSVEPDVGRVANGAPFRVDRLKSLGNSVVPACAREAFSRLMFG